VKWLAVTLISLILLAAPLTAGAQQARKVARVGVLTPASGPSALFEALRAGLHELGYVEGRDVMIEYRFAKGDLPGLPRLARELIALPVDIIVTDGTAAAHAAKQATTTIPVVMAAISDPVRSGIVTSLARPGNNITGLTLLAPELSGKRLELLAQALGRVALVGALWVAGNPNCDFLFEETREAARSLGLDVRPVRLRAVEDVEPAIRDAALHGVRALVVLADVILWNNRANVVRAVSDHRLPTIYEAREYVEAGGLMSYGLSIPESFRRAAGYVDKILKGAKPADLPVEQPTKFELVINMKTAKTLDLTIPPAVLARADELIQ
jgi:putative ABC transport system substrate-binding protein